MFSKPLVIKIALGVLAVVLLGGGLWFGKGALKNKERDGLYAVFLTNNQVYFGTIRYEDRKTVLLKNIYYIQYKDQNQAAATADISLLKLGNELHGPEDQMEINRDHVLFIEKLKSDGRVAKAIADYKPTK